MIMVNLASFKKIALVVLLILLMIAVIYHAYSNNQEALLLPHALPNPVIDHVSKEFILNSSRFAKKLKPSQIEQVQALLESVNLNSKIALKQFLNCAGRKLMLYAKSPHIPPSHQHCKNMSFKNSGLTVALGSFPGSGNSWVRQLLESATGIYSGALYCDGSYIGAGMIGEGVTTNNVIAIKTHDWPISTGQKVNPDKGIYIVRSPFGSILSEHNRYQARKLRIGGDRHSAEIDPNRFNLTNSVGWGNKVKGASNKWAKIVGAWLNTKKFPVLIVGYENLMKDTYTELKRMLDFIEYPYSEDDVLCAVKKSAEGFHRNHSKRYLSNPYSPEVQNFVLDQIKTIDASLLKHDISLYHPYTI